MPALQINNLHEQITNMQTNGDNMDGGILDRYFFFFTFIESFYILLIWITRNYVFINI